MSAIGELRLTFVDHRRIKGREHAGTSSDVWKLLFETGSLTAALNRESWVCLVSAIEVVQKISPEHQASMWWWSRISKQSGWLVNKLAKTDWQFSSSQMQQAAFGWSIKVGVGQLPTGSRRGTERLWSLRKLRVSLTLPASMRR